MSAMTAYFVAFVDDDGSEHVVSTPYASRRDAEYYANFLKDTMGYADAHVRVAENYEGQAITSDALRRAAGEIH